MGETVVNSHSPIQSDSRAKNQELKLLHVKLIRWLSKFTYFLIFGLSSIWNRCRFGVEPEFVGIIIWFSSVSPQPKWDRDLKLNHLKKVFHIFTSFDVSLQIFLNFTVCKNFHILFDFRRLSYSALGYSAFWNSIFWFSTF